MILTDEFLDDFKAEYAIDDEDIPMLEEALKLGMLAAADIVVTTNCIPSPCNPSQVEYRYTIARAIREKAYGND